jgi:ABC-type Na+ efflux pump permease subunit
MLGGPVLRAELLRTARKRRYYWVRAVYATLLLAFVGSSYSDIVDSSEARMPTINQMAELGSVFFYQMLKFQLVCVLAFVPAFLASVIADEKQRRTLHYLMASQLTSREIISDKLAARLLHLGLYLAIGLPIVCLVALFGGLAPLDVAAGYGVILATGFFAAAVTVLVSTFARSVRQAVMVAYIVQAAWLAGVPLLIGLAGLYLRRLIDTDSQWFQTIGPWLEVMALGSTPFGMFLMTRWVPRMGTRAFQGPVWVWAPQHEVLAVTMAVYFVLGVIVLWIAITQLRPAFRRQVEKPRRLNWFKQKAQKAPRKRAPVEKGASPVFWKECHFARTDIFTKLFVLPATAILTVGLLLGSGIDEWGWAAIKNLWGHGYTSHFGNERLTEALRLISPYYIGLWLLAVAGASVSSVTVEREQNTWESLLATPLTGPEILFGKMLGAVWGLRGFGVLLALFWVFGLLVWAVHPLGLIAALTVVAVHTWFVTALAFYIGLKTKNTGQALAGTIAILVILNGGYLLPIQVFLNSLGPLWLGEFGCGPWLAAQALASPFEIHELLTWLQGRSLGLSWLRGALYGCGAVILYASAAAFLSWRSVARFDALIDRPRLRESALQVPIEARRARRSVVEARAEATAETPA